MKYTAILVLVLVLVNGSNMRSNKGTTSHDNLVEIKSEWVGEAQDLSGNVGIISQEVTEAYTLTNQDRIEKAESKERSAIHKAINKSHKSFVQVEQIDNMPFVEETLDQSPQKEINFADLFTNDGLSPDMGTKAVIEDDPSAPMNSIPQDDNLEYIRTIDKLDLLDEHGQPLQLLPEELTLLEMSQFESRFQPTDTPSMEAAPAWDLQAAYEKSPGQSELSPEELQRETDSMVDSLKGELTDDDI